MAKHEAIAAVSKGIVQLLENSKATFKSSNGAPTALLIDANQFNTGLEGDTLRISVFLYRVAINASVRIPPQRRQADGIVYRAPLPLDLFYLITPWAKAVDVQHSLLGWAMRTLHDSPTIPATLINDPVLYGDDPPLRATECVELTYDPLSIADLLGLWDKLKTHYQTSATYIARLVTIESESEFPVGLPVQTREFDLLGERS